MTRLITPTTLTVQEERVLRLRAQGMPSKAIAEALTISTQTVKNHISAIYHKLEVDNLASAMIAAGWVRIPGETMPRYEQCRFVGRCGRPAEHRGQHGGFREVVNAPALMRPSSSIPRAGDSGGGRAAVRT